MFHHANKPTNLSSTTNRSPRTSLFSEVPTDQYSGGLVLTTDPKPRLRWTTELHERFEDAVAQLGGPDKATPKTIMRIMGVKGLTLYHLKSHLQKFRLGKQPLKETNLDHWAKEDRQRNTTACSSTGIMGRPDQNVHIAAEALRMQMEVHRRLHEQLEVQKHLQMRVEAQGKYMQTILEKAWKTLRNENPETSHSYKSNPHQSGLNSDIKDLSSSINFHALKDLNSYNNDGTSDQPRLHQNIDQAGVQDNCLLSLRKKRSNPNSTLDVYNSKSTPLTIWSDDHNNQRQRGTLADHHSGLVADHNKNFVAPAKLEIPSSKMAPVTALERANSVSKDTTLLSANFSCS